MTDISLSTAFWDYDRVAALVDGRVSVPGVRLRIDIRPPSELFPLAVGPAPYDVTEISLSSYIMQLSRGETPYTAIPVFLSRAFRHNAIYVNAAAGIVEPADLAGKRVGIPEYQMTAAVWMRGMLKDDYGVDPTGFQTRTGAVNGGVRKERLELSLPPEFDVKPISAGTCLDAMLRAGDLDAVLSPTPPNGFLEGDDRVRRLFADYAEVERAYYKRTGFFPIMHVVAVRRALAKAHPELCRNLFEAFTAARDMALERLEAVWRGSANRLALPWFHADFERTRSLMGDAYWSYGVAENRAELERFCGYSVDQHLSARRLRPEEMFEASENA